MKYTTNERINAAVKFLGEINSQQEVEGYTFLGTRRNWCLFYRNDDLKEARRIIAENVHDDLYFCPTVFSQPRRKIAYALRSVFSHCDCDEGDPFDCDVLPSWVIETSPGRTSALWRWDGPHSPDRIAAYNYSIVHQIKRDCREQSGWEVTKFLRLPYTFNHKYDPPTLVTIDCKRFLPYRALGPIRDRPEIGKIPVYDHKDVSISFRDLPPFREVLRKYPKPWLGGYLHPAPKGKRSDVIWKIMMTLAEQNASPKRIASVVMASGAFKSKSQELPNPLRWLEDQIGRAIATAEKGSR